MRLRACVRVVGEGGFEWRGCGCGRGLLAGSAGEVGRGEVRACFGIRGEVGRGAVVVIQGGRGEVLGRTVVRGGDCGDFEGLGGMASVGDVKDERSASTESIISSKLLGLISLRSEIPFLFVFFFNLFGSPFRLFFCVFFVSISYCEISTFLRSSVFCASRSAIWASFRFTMPAGSRRQCRLLSLDTLIREGKGREGRGQSGGGAVEDAVKRSMAVRVW